MKMENFKKYGFIVAILIVLTTFVNVGIQTFYPAPEYRDCYRPRIEFEKPVELTEEEKAEIEQCEKESREERNFYNRNVFIVLLIIGLIILLIGLSLSHPIVANGLLFSGILNILIGIIRYWSEMQDYLRFVISGLVLIILIYISYKKIK